MKAIILAAGQGRRLRPFTNDCPKCLLRLNGFSILEYQLRQLEQLSIDQVILVCGFGSEQVCAAVAEFPDPLSIKTLYNPFYAMTDNLISLWSVRAEMDEDFLLLNGDGVFHPAILQRLVKAEDPCCLMVARKAAYDPDDMKVRIRQERIVEIGKHLPPEQTDAESIGAMRFSGCGVGLLRQALSEIVIEPQALKSHFPAVIQQLIGMGHLPTYQESNDLPWADVDTPEDLHFVRQRLPQFQLPPSACKAKGES